MRKKRFKYAFAGKKEAEGGLASLTYAGLSLGIFLVSVVTALVTKGNNGILFGAMGLAAMLFALCGFVTGLVSFSEKDRKHRGSVIGSLINGILAVTWLSLYLVGI